MPENREWLPIESAPYGVWVLAWLHLPKNPPASAPAIMQRCYVEEEDGPDIDVKWRRTFGCWWSACGLMYAEGHVTHWMDLPPPPALPEPPQ